MFCEEDKFIGVFFFRCMQLLVVLKKANRMTDYKDQAAARRLTVVRSLYAEDKKEFAELLGIKPSRWNNLERGYPMTMQIAWLLIKLDDRLSIDYLALGKFGNIPPDFAETLKTRERQLFPSEGENKRRRQRLERAAELRRKAVELESESRPLGRSLRR